VTDEPSSGFAGFPHGKLRLTPVPNLFFAELLPAIDHLGELRVTLYAFWALAQKEGPFQYLRAEEIAADKLFMRAFEHPSMPAEEALAEALERAVARGTLLKASPAAESEGQSYYFLNSVKGRAAVHALELGEWRPSGDPEAPVELAIERPNVYTLYEQNIGPLTPMIAERLRDAEERFPARWIRDAIAIAVENNVRKWRYVEAILEDWDTRGRDEQREDRGDTEKARRRYLSGEFADYIES
jgi:DnaD/phage-associated family protein